MTKMIPVFCDLCYRVIPRPDLFDPYWHYDLCIDCYDAAKDVWPQSHPTWIHDTNYTMTQ